MLGDDYEFFFYHLGSLLYVIVVSAVTPDVAGAVDADVAGVVDADVVNAGRYQAFSLWLF